MLDYKDDFTVDNQSLISIKEDGTAKGTLGQPSVTVEIDGVKIKVHLGEVCDFYDDSEKTAL